MKLVNQSQNANVLKLKDGTEILFSYETPVAGYAHNLGRFKSDQKYSTTTNKHINAYFGGPACAKDVLVLPQSEIDNIIKKEEK